MGYSFVVHTSMGARFLHASLQFFNEVVLRCLFSAKQEFAKKGLLSGWDVRFHPHCPGWRSLATGKERKRFQFLWQEFGSSNHKKHKNRKTSGYVVTRIFLTGHFLVPYFRTILPTALHSFSWHRARSKAHTSGEETMPKLSCLDWCSPTTNS